MRVKIIADIREFTKAGVANVGCKIVQERSVNFLLPVAFEAILKAMKDTNKSAFYDAMANFANEDFDGAKEFLMGERDND